MAKSMVISFLFFLILLLLVSLFKDKLSKHYPDLQLMKGPEYVVKKIIEEAITHYWELLDSKVFDTLTGSMVDMVEAIIKADG
ncbi:hypothetical protein L873DRAFT_1802816 [Choiromyces venosus 120613-1]|uniref:Cytochrome P450 n=1 Tax=Choiromyces venosus 120613-1 TaxID=1336337 RepID=A0A3N4JY67_9PEZI|nr:hypothetical protein L873DRAFT_1802816 [Choiromyces venosus 120613-1]